MPKIRAHGRSRGGLSGLLIGGVLSLGWGIVLAQNEAPAESDCPSPGERQSTAEDLVRAADCRRTEHDFAGAAALLETALLAEGAAARAVAIRGRLGQLYLALGNPQAALDELLRGVGADDARASPQIALLLNDLGNAYMALDRPLEGLAAFADAARLARDPSVATSADVNFARALWESGSRDGLAQRLERARRAARSLVPSAATTKILLALAALYRETGVGEAARARELATAALRSAQEEGDALLAANAYGEIGAAHAEAGDLDQALTYTRQAVALAQSSGAADSLYRWEWQTGRLLRALRRTDAALAAYAAAIDTLGLAQTAAATSRRGFRRDVLPLYEEYADLMLASTRGMTEAAAHDALASVQVNLERLRLAEVRNYFENECAVPEVFASSQTRANILVVYPMLFADRTELLVGLGDRLVQFTVNVGLAEMTRATRLLRDAAANPDSGAAYLVHAQRLYRWLIEPLRELLPQDAQATLVIVPDGPLRTVPFALLHDGERFLIERYALATTPGLSLVGAVTGEPISRVLVNGLVAPVQGFPGLPFVADELASIARTFPSRVYSDESFVTATLEREIVAGGYSIVHMATHAQFESDYRRSFLLTHDDVITMDDLEDVVGSQRYTEQPVDLLVLSACQTAAGDERAALGLAGVAVKAGARSALASLWSVSDEATARLIAEFYRQLADGQGKANALRGAQLLLLNEDRHSHPAFWAPFLMIGDWR